MKLGVIRLLGRKIPALLMLLCERRKAFRGSVTDTLKVMNDSLNYLGLLCLASKAPPGCVATNALFSHAISLSGGRRIWQVKTVAAASGVLTIMLVTPLCFFALPPQWSFTMVCVPPRLSPQVFRGERHVSAQHQGPTVAPSSCLLALPCSGLVDAAAGATTAPTAEPWVLHERKNKKRKIDQKDKEVGEGADDDGADDEAEPGDQWASDGNDTVSAEPSDDDSNVEEELEALFNGREDGDDDEVVPIHQPTYKELFGSMTIRNAVQEVVYRAACLMG